MARKQDQKRLNETQNQPEVAASPAQELLARIMPWVMSGMLHVSIIVILLFLGILIQVPPPAAVVAGMGPAPILFDPPNFTLPVDPGSMGDSNHRLRTNATPPQPGRNDTTLRPFKPNSNASSLIFRTDNSLTAPPRTGQKGMFNTVETLYRSGGPGNKGPGKGGLGTGTDGDGLGGGGLPCDIVFVIDRSGSMSMNVEQLKLEMLRSISRMPESNTFHVIMFSEGQPLENPPRRLVPAQKENLKNLTQFLTSMQCVGRTDPLPALKRGFEVVSKGQPGRLKVICLLTDGAFPDNGKVQQAIDEMNRARKVRVYTFLYGENDPDAEAFMKRIARDHNGLYNYRQPGALGAQ